MTPPRMRISGPVLGSADPVALARKACGSVEVPNAVRRKALALGEEGRRWLDDLGAIVAGLEAEWRVQVGPAIDGGSAAFVANAVADDGTAAVLKVAMPDGLVGNSPFEEELETLRLGAGRGYVEVFRADTSRRAMLQERLGQPLDSLGLPVESQIDIIVATVRRGWHRLPDDATLRTGADQARFLREFINARSRDLDLPCSPRTLQRAEEYTVTREAAFDPRRSVLIHGDAHPANVLEAGGRDASSHTFKLIDPDGMRSEPAHDLAIPLRDWTSELLAGSAVDLGLEWCAQLATRSGASAQAIWEWAFVERVSTGLFLMQLGDPSGARFLRVADCWNRAEP
jgi:streptomycin 6-kinase